MSLFPSPLAAAFAGTGLAFFAIGATRRPDPGLKLSGLAVIAFALAPVPAHADQFVEAADNATIDCELARGEATQLFITNPALAKSEAAEWEAKTGPEDAAIRLIEAMVTDGVLPGFSARAEMSLPRRTGGIEVQLVAEYEGDELTLTIRRVPGPTNIRCRCPERLTISTWTT